MRAASYVVRRIKMATLARRTARGFRAGNGRRGPSPELARLASGVARRAAGVRPGRADVQLSLPFRGWGGRRAGAGRKPKGARAGVSHVERPAVSRHLPLHVTLRMVRRLPSLRSEAILHEVRRALAKGKERFGMRVVHYSVQDDHVHLVVEAADRRALTRGMRGLDVRLARGVNRAVGRTGRVLGDRYHARALRSPREVRNALAYVLLNWRKHSRSRRDAWDLASSGPVFDGWRGADPGERLSPALLERIAETRAAPRLWLLRVGWRRAGLIAPVEIPGGAITRGARR